MTERIKLEDFIQEEAWFLPDVWKRQTNRLKSWEKTSDKDRQDLLNRLLCAKRCLELLPRELTERVTELCAELDADASFAVVASRLELKDVAPKNVATWFEQLAPSFQPVHLASDEARIVSTIICWVVLPLDGKEHGDTECFLYEFFQPLCFLFALHSAEAYEAAAFLGELIAGLHERDYAEQEGLKNRLDALDANRGHVFHVANLIYVIADSVQRLPTRGRRQAIALLECWMGIQEGDRLQPTVLHEKLTKGPLGLVNPTLQVILIELLASSLNGICDAESFGRASILLESWLNIREADYQTSDRMTKALQDSPLAGISQQTLWANTITTFSLSLSLWRLRGRRHAYQLLEAWLRNWLEISIDCFDTPGDLSNRVIGQLKSKLGDNTFTGSVVTHLSDFWIGEAKREPRFYQQSESLLMAFMGLEQSDFNEVSRLQKRLLIRRPLIDKLHVLMLAHAAHGSGRQCQNIKNLLEAWLDTSIHDFAVSPRWKDYDSTALAFPETWLRYAEAEDELIPRVCNAMVEFACQHRIALRVAPLNQEDFLKSVSARGQGIICASLRHAQHLREVNRLDDAEEIEIRILGWAESFENSVIAEKARERGVQEGTTSGETLKFSDWPFSHTSRPSDSDFQDGYLPISACESHPLQRAFSKEEDSLHQSRERASQSRVRQAEHAAFAIGWDLNKLIPPNAVLMRTLFDSEGKLHFWAVQRTANGLRILSRKTSQTDAFGRLRVAVFAFDLAVERIWVSSMTAPGTEVLNAAQLDLLNFLGDLASGKQFVEDDEGVQLIVSALYPLLERLQKTHPVLSQTGFRMLKGVLNDARADQSRARRDVELAFLHSWGENLKRIRHCSSDSPLNRDARRRQQLDDATSSFCDEISREFSFPEVFSETQGIIDWAQQDLIFQFQWMLWSCPVSSVLFGGKPLFQQVCSITNVISLGWIIVLAMLMPALKTTPKRFYPLNG